MLEAVSRIGRLVFALAIAAMGVETWILAQRVAHSLGPQTRVIPVIPWLPALPWLAYLGGAIWIACAVGLLVRSTIKWSGLVLGGAFCLCAVIIVLPLYAAQSGSIPLRTVVFEPLAIGCLAWLMAGRAMPAWLTGTARYLVALSLIVFGVDHFLVLVFIGSLLPAWIPWHLFWAGFFGVAFVAAGLSVAFNFLLRPAAFCIGLMFAIWVFTLHLPRVLGLYGIAGAPRSPDEWSSLLIAVALWGGLWTLARDNNG